MLLLLLLVFTGGGVWWQIDGVDALNNILLIGMTNRKDMLDEAMLRCVQQHVGMGRGAGGAEVWEAGGAGGQAGALGSAD